jgi:hypothetical protein
MLSEIGKDARDIESLRDSIQQMQREFSTMQSEVALIDQTDRDVAFLREENQRLKKDLQSVRDVVIDSKRSTIAEMDKRFEAEKGAECKKIELLCDTVAADVTRLEAQILAMAENFKMVNEQYSSLRQMLTTLYTK